MTIELPVLDGVVRVDGLDDAVQIFRDAIGVPHVRAQTTHDAFFGQGFVHAQDRLWQMCYDRRRAAGRLAEWLGPRRVRMDAFCRRMGLEASARADHDAFDDPTRSMLDAYAAGVNAFLASGAPLPVELELLGATQDPWEPWHCGAVLKVRHVLMGSYDRKLWRAQLASALGPDVTVTLGSSHGREDPLIVPVGGSAAWEARREELEPTALATAGLDLGSNNWAVHGSRTASGLPLVAGDPHRTLEIPNVYYQNHMACPELDCIGLSMPGVPGLFHFAHNAHVAWCVTHAMADTQDLFVERFDESGRYSFRGEWLECERRTESIRVRDSGDVTVDVVRTHHGPVVFGDPRTGTAITLRWTGTDRPNTTLRSILPMLRSSSVDELDEAMRDWVDPCNNVVMADTGGAIAYLHRGRVPVRPRANGWGPVPGWTGDHEWDEDVPYEELPRLRDPDRGFIATANNRVCGDDYPHYLGMDYSSPYRALRVLERLGPLEKATADDMSDVHADRVSLASEHFREAVERVVPWDGRMDAASPGAAVYAVLRESMAELLCEREPLRRVVANPFTDDPLPTPAIYRVRVALPRLIERDDTTITGGATWAEVAGEALERAVSYLERTLGPDRSSWRWDRLHTVRVRHPLSSVFGDRAELLDPPVVACGGDGECVQATGWETGLGVQHGSVARYVFDLADWDASSWVVPFGSSGHPASPHYADQAGDWAAVRHHPMTYSWERIESGAEYAQRLEPTRDST